MAQDTYDDALRVRIDEQKQILIHKYSPNITFEGRCYHGATTSEAAWQIKRIFTSGEVTKIDFANKALYNQIWDNRVAIFADIPFFYNVKSISFDGVNDHLLIANNSLITFAHTAAFSWSTWIKTTDSGANTILYKRLSDASQQGYSINKTAGGEISFTLRQSSSSVLQVTSTSAAIASGAWKHLVVTYDGSAAPGGVKIYVNGTSLSLTTNSNTLAGTSASSADLYIAASTPGTSNNLSCKLDELALFNKSLSSAEVTALYNSGDPGDLALHAAIDNLILWLRMGDGDEFPILQDQAGLNDVTMVNMTRYDISSDVP